LAKEALALAEKAKHPETIARAHFGAANISTWVTTAYIYSVKPIYSV
jgi:hypothetical protein